MIEPRGDDLAEYLQLFTAYAYPIAEPVPGQVGRLRRSWTLRTRDVLPDVALVHAAGKVAETRARERLMAAYGDNYDEAALIRCAPRVTFTVVDSNHVIVHLEFSDSEHSIGDAAAIATWGVLQDLDEHWPIEDLQGIPRRYWFPLNRPHPLTEGTE